MVFSLSIFNRLFIQMHRFSLFSPLTTFLICLQFPMYALFPLFLSFPLAISLTKIFFVILLNLANTHFKTQCRCHMLQESCP